MENDNNIFTKKTYKINNIFCEDCVEGMKKIKDNSIDLVVTSPPYYGIRDYNCFTLYLHKTG